MSNEHAGHRSRMRERFLRDGLDGFADHEVLECALYYAIPRKNTNELAHRLLDRFGTLNGVLAATPQELGKFAGMTPGAIGFLQFLSQFYRRTRLEAHPLRQSTSLQEIAAFFVEFYRGYTHESVQLLLLDNAARVIRNLTLAEGASGSVTIPFDRLSELVITNGAAMFVLAHNHPNGSCTPSAADLQVTERIETLFRQLEHPMREHILIAGEQHCFLCEEIRKRRAYAAGFGKQDTP